PAAERNEAKAAEPVTAAKGETAFAGRVLGPDGQPVAGAALDLTPPWVYLNRQQYSSPVNATTGPDGRFAFTVSKTQFGDPIAVVTATAANHGLAWLPVTTGGQADDLTLQLVAD